MSGGIVSVQGLGKRYRLRHAQADRYDTLRDAIAAGMKAPIRWLNGSGRETTEEFWALNDVSFEAGAGEVVGIVGRNGAGKSTLLKILSRITEPTKGRVVLDGRVASLLEVGTGFHPELTGRENVYLNGAILGMSRAEIVRKFDAIVSFAGVEAFLDTPVKRYSSGMFVRLAFAVAAHLDPEILIVDEVLAVGDLEFQQRSLGKMHEVSRSGRTVLFVSHNLAAVQTLCGRALWLDRGRVAAVGGVTDVVGRYLHAAQPVAPGLVGPVPLGDALELRSFSLSPNPLPSGESLTFSATIGSSRPVKLAEVAILVYSSLQIRVAIVDLRSAGLPVRLEGPQVWTVTGTISAVNLVEGEYRFGLFVNSSDFAGDVQDLVSLTVRAREREHTGRPAPYAAAHRGLVELDFQVKG